MATDNNSSRDPSHENHIFLYIYINIIVLFSFVGWGFKYVNTNPAVESHLWQCSIVDHRQKFLLQPQLKLLLQHSNGVKPFGSNWTPIATETNYVESLVNKKNLCFEACQLVEELYFCWDIHTFGWVKKMLLMQHVMIHHRPSFD